MAHLSKRDDGEDDDRDNLPPVVSSSTISPRVAQYRPDLQPCSMTEGQGGGIGGGGSRWMRSIGGGNAG